MTRSIGRKLRDSFSSITAINTVLHNDTLRCLNQLGTELQPINACGEISNHTRYLLKKTVRVFVGQVDGLAYVLRQAVVESADETGLALTNRQRAELCERRYDKTSDVITDKPAFLNTLDALKLALRYFPRLFGSPYTLDTNGVAWRALKRLVDVRNGMMHPASLNEMSPANAVPVLAQTITWFFYEISRMYADIAPRIGVKLQSIAPIADPFAGYDERAHQCAAPFSDQDHEAIAANRSQSLKYAEAFLDHCHDERRRAIEEVGRHRGRHILTADYQSDVRNALCMVFATVEAMIFVAKRFVVAAETRNEITLSPGDHDALENGEVEDRLASAMTLWSREFGNGQLWETTGEAWKSFRGARFRRNQLAHPKSIEKLRITVADLTYLSASLSYYSRALGSMHLGPRWLALAGDP